MVSKKTQRTFHGSLIANTSIRCGAKTTTKQPLCNSKATRTWVALKAFDHLWLAPAELYAGVSTPNGRPLVEKCTPRGGRPSPAGRVASAEGRPSVARDASRHAGRSSR